MNRIDRQILGLGIALFLLGQGPLCTADETLVIASWNVENLFDTENDPDNKGDDGFTPRGWMRWTDARYALKLKHLAEVIALMRPDILCLTEIENRRVLEDLSRVLLEMYSVALSSIVHRDGAETRGIDVAILARQDPVKTQWLQPVKGQREVLICRFIFDERPVTLVVNHWKSQLGKKAVSDEIRGIEAQAVRAWLDDQLQLDPAAAILVAGDFNDNPESPVIVEKAGFVTDESRVRTDPTGRLLFNLTATLPEDSRSTYYYAKTDRWQTLDAMSVSRGMLEGCRPAAPWRVSDSGYTIFRTPAQKLKNGAPRPFRRMRGKAYGDIFQTGYSDHFPIRVVLEPAKH